MVIEIDRKKIERARKRYRERIFSSVIAALSLSCVGLVVKVMYDISFFAILPAMVSSFLFTILGGTKIIQRSRRYLRTDHHLYLDEDGIAFIMGHERVDIPWGDIENIKYTLGFDRLFDDPDKRDTDADTHFTLHLRPDTPYTKRKYHVYNDYEVGIYELSQRAEDLWLAGRRKRKATI